MNINKILIANRGEIAIRIARAAATMDIASVAIYSADDATCLHTSHANEAIQIPGHGARAYLDIEAIIAAAKSTGANALHPGYGFLSESAALAQRCAEENIIFIGPTPNTLAMLGDKAAAREFAQRCSVPVVPGSEGGLSLTEAEQFVAARGGAPVVIKAVSGGGGRGMRLLYPGDDIANAFNACAREAQAAFGDARLYAEQFIERARHIEVQILGDSKGNVVHFWERECSLQRRHQKLVEIAPSPTLPSSVRQQLLQAAMHMAKQLQYVGLGTFEFLVPHNSDTFYFMEANPRLQVEHTITEEITGVDLVQAQIAVFTGRSLAELGLQQAPAAHGYALQCRVNMETMDANGDVQPSGGTITAFAPPTGPGVRVDTFGYSGYTNNPSFDSLLAKVIVHSRASDYAQAVHTAYRALCQFHIAGVATNIPFLQALLTSTEVLGNQVYTRFVDDHWSQLIAASQKPHPQLYQQTAATHQRPTHAATMVAPAGSKAVTAPMQGQLSALLVAEGETVAAQQVLAIVEAMKMEHEIKAPQAGIVRGLPVPEGEVLQAEQAIVFLETTEDEGHIAQQHKEVDPDYIRPDLAEFLQRDALTKDAARPEAIAKRHARGMLSARENIANLCDPDSFLEYGSLTFAAQRRRRSTETLMRTTPADGLITGIGAVNGDLFPEEAARCAVLAYDYTVLAGTQGIMNHRKTDRILYLAEEQQLPIIFFTEGGGGRPGDTDNSTIVAGLDTPSFLQYARLTALAPRIAIVSGRCFAGNAVLAGSSDLLIATQSANLGMAGPAMIEGGGLGVYAAEEVGPMAVQTTNGVVDCLVENEAEAATLARKLMAYFQGSLPRYEAADQRLLRASIPENRLRSYDIHALINTLVDSHSFVELRPTFAPGMVTGFARIEGRPIGIIANNSMHLGGAICANGADKAARFMQLCDAFDIPLLSLCDTPGFMVGPEAEKTALVRHTSRLFVTAATVQTPVFTVVLRKGYGLGAMAMTAGSFHAPFFNAAWPTGEFGGMGLEGAVRLGFRDELANAGDSAAQKALFDKLVAQQYEQGKALSMAAALEIDAVIDPADTRSWVLRGLKSVRKPSPRQGRRRTMIDTW